MTYQQFKTEAEKLGYTKAQINACIKQLEKISNWSIAKVDEIHRVSTTTGIFHLLHYTHDYFETINLLQICTEVLNLNNQARQ